jgi:CDP-paratose 2-epimerase
VKRVLITGGAGFVGSSMAIELARRSPDWTLIALDNLHRRGSELNVPRLERAGVRFVRGDVRAREALLALEKIDALLECSAEPSALAGMTGDTAYPFDTNLVGAYNCLELARRDGADFLFLSTSRVYPYGPLSRLRLDESPTRFELAAEQDFDGVSRAGISERFPLAGARTIYGATKLAAELLIEEFAANFGLRTVVNRCGVIAGPWQMGRVDQGVFAHWLIHHHLGIPLRYIGHGGAGKQVRDLLHVSDLVDLVAEQLTAMDAWAGFVGNVGGGRGCSLSLAEATDLCRELTGRTVPIDSAPGDRPGDVPLYISDCSALHSRTGWRASRGAREILEDTLAWIEENEAALTESLRPRGARPG